MKRYKAESCHEIGYKWEIDAPAALSPDDVEALQSALCDYTDTPAQNDLHELLVAPSMFLADYIEDLNAEKLALVALVTFTVESVHREVFTQSFREE